MSKTALNLSQTNVLTYEKKKVLQCRKPREVHYCECENKGVVKYTLFNHQEHRARACPGDLVLKVEKDLNPVLDHRS